VTRPVRRALELVYSLSVFDLFGLQLTLILQLNVSNLRAKHLQLPDTLLKPRV